MNDTYPLEWDDAPPIVIGCDWSTTLGLQNDDGTPVDMTAYAMALTLYDPNGATVADVQTNGTFTNGGTLGIAVALPRAFTAGLMPMVASLFASYTVNGLVKPWLKGTISIEVKS